MKIGKAMTLVELLVGLVITSLIGAAAFGVSTAITNAAGDSQAGSESVHAGRIGLLNIQRTVRRSKLILASDDGRVALWCSDAYDPGQINVDEVVLLQYDSTEGTVTQGQVQFPPEMSEERMAVLNSRLALADLLDASRVRSVVGNASHWQGRQVATGVERLTFMLDQAGPMARAVTIRATFSSDGRAVAFNTAATPRGLAVDSVMFENGRYVLVAPSESGQAGQSGGDGCGNGGGRGRGNGGGRGRGNGGGRDHGNGGGGDHGNGGGRDHGNGGGRDHEDGPGKGHEGGCGK